MGALPLQRASDRLDRWFELGVFGAAVATVPQTILHLMGFSGAVVSAIDWVLWSVFLADLLNLVARGRPSTLVKPRVIAIAIIVAFSIPILPTLFALIRLARLALVNGAKE